MTLGNMRELGARSLAVTCELCTHQVAHSVVASLIGRAVHVQL